MRRDRGPGGLGWRRRLRSSRPPVRWDEEVRLLIGTDGGDGGFDTSAVCTHPGQSTPDAYLRAVAGSAASTVGGRSVGSATPSAATGPAGSPNSVPVGQATWALLGLVGAAGLVVAARRGLSGRRSR